MDELTRAIINTIQTLEESRQAGAARAKLESKLARSTPADRDRLEQQVHKALINHIQAMRHCDNTIVTLAEIALEKLWLPPYDDQIARAWDVPCAQSTENPSAAWLHEQLSSVWPNRASIGRRRLLRRVIDALRCNLHRLATDDIQKILAEHSREQHSGGV